MAENKRSRQAGYLAPATWNSAELVFGREGSGLVLDIHEWGFFFDGKLSEN